MKAVTAATMRQLDSSAIEGLKLPGVVLMENAGRGAYRLLKKALDERGLTRVLVLCGPGNNGGDGYVIARHLANNGYHVVIAVTKAGRELKGDAKVNWQVARNMGLKIQQLRADADVAKIFKRLGPFDAICDALLGTGVSKDLGGLYLDLVRWANAQPCYRFAIDIPTGIHADSSAVLEDAFRADATATFGLPKLGLCLYPGADYAGEIHVVDISIAAGQLEKAPGVELLLDQSDLPEMPERAPNAYKNRFGHLLLVAGSPGKGGAALLSGEASLRTGVGLCTLATHPGCSASLEGRVPDLMVEALDWGERLAEDLGPVVAGKSAIAIGPGLGIAQKTRKLVEIVVSRFDLPLVVDADGLNAFAGDVDKLKRPHAPTIITPHPGEMARLLDLTTAQVEADRLAIAAGVAAKLGVVVVLKGARTVVAAPDGRRALNMSGSPAMAKAGSGDVLTGMLGALLAMGLDAYDAARLGVFLHGRCGEITAEALGVHGVLASDLGEAIPAVLSQSSMDEGGNG